MKFDEASVEKVVKTYTAVDVEFDEPIEFSNYYGEMYKFPCGKFSIARVRNEYWVDFIQLTVPGGRAFSNVEDNEELQRKTNYEYDHPLQKAVREVLEWVKSRDKEQES